MCTVYMTYWFWLHNFWSVNSLAVCNLCAHRHIPCETIELVGFDLFVQSLDDLSLLDGSSNFSHTHFIFPPGVVFDAVLALAQGLMGAADRVSRNDSSGCESVPGELVPLEEFSYFKDRMGCILRQSLAKVSFVGVTVSWQTVPQMTQCCLLILPSHHSFFRVWLNSTKMVVD